ASCSGGVARQSARRLLRHVERDPESEVVASVVAPLLLRPARRADRRELLLRVLPAPALEDSELEARARAHLRDVARHVEGPERRHAEREAPDRRGEGIPVVHRGIALLEALAAAPVREVRSRRTRLPAIPPGVLPARPSRRARLLRLGR